MVDALERARTRQTHTAPLDSAKEHAMPMAVTAASGQLGQAVIRALLELDTDEPIVALARTPANAQGLGVEVRPGDYGDVGQLTASLAGVDALLLVSGNEAPEARIKQHRNVLEAAKAAGVAKIVFTSVQGAEEGTACSPVIASSRQTEADVRSGGMDWSIGRNGIYIEPDLAAMNDYVATGEVTNCAGDGRCGYTTRTELAAAYAHMLTESQHDGRTYHLHGEPITQTQLVGHLNDAFGTALVYRPLSVDDYRADRIEALGEFMGTIIAGIYEGIRQGEHDRPSDYAAATGRPHMSWADHFASLQVGAVEI